MSSRRMQLIFLALVASLIIGRAVVGSPAGLTVQQAWERLTR